MHVVAVTTCVTAGPDGLRVRLKEGTVWPADHPVVRHRPGLFRSIDDAPAPIETAAADVAPIKRGPGRPRKTAQ